MGAISFTLDRSLVRELQSHLPFQLFVETGTFRGESLASVQDLFAECFSVELSPEYFAAAQQRFAGSTRVHLALGDSATVLRQERPRFAGKPTLFWLDAHWCAAEDTAGEISQCPLLAELEAIGPLSDQSAVLIDDARLFLCPPPKPHEISAWPDFDAVLRGLRQLSDRHALVCFNDVLVFIPAAVLPKLRPYLHAHAVNLLTLADKSRDFDSVLTQAKEKESEIAQKDAEIRQLATAADERLALVHQLDLSVKEHRRILAEIGRDPAQGKGPLDPTTLAEEVCTLRLRMEEARRQLQTKQRHIEKLEALVTGSSRKTEPTRWQRMVARWRAGLASRTTRPLAKLQQYPPRPLQLEKFPPPPQLARWPRICLATPSYQHASFLERTMRSALDQNYPNLAYGVQDGASTDGSVEIILKHLPRLAHAESAPDQGQSDAIRRGFAKLYPENNDLMGWLNSDDLLMPGALHCIGAYFARHPEVDVVYGHRVIIDESDREVGRWFLPPYHADTLKWFDLVPQETMFWRARCYREIGGLDASYHFALDWDLLLRFEHAGFNIKRLPYFLGCFRVHAQQKTSAQINSVGEQEMARLRRRTHGREVPAWEIQRHLTAEINHSAQIEWLHGHGWRS